MFSLKSSLLLLGSIEVVLGAVAGTRPVIRDSSPNNPTDPKTTTYCSWWHDYNEATPCSQLVEENLITLEQFRRWNPSVTVACGGLTVGRSYCVEAAGEPAPQPGTTTSTSTRTTSTSTKVTTSTSSTIPSPTKPANGITTPLPTQPDIVGNCDKFYLVKSNEGCADIATKNGITLAQFLLWNPKAGSNCAGLWADANACVSIIGHEPTPTNPGNGITTPLPTQPNIVGNCDKFYMVKSGEGCADIASKNGITLAQFLTWNPSAGSTCSGLWSEANACVSIIGHEPTPTNPGNGITTPTPAQPNIVTNCNKFYLVKPNEGCADIASKNGITLAQFTSWNRNAGTNCAGLWANAYACISIIGFTPTPTNPGNGVATPSPIQTGMVTNCKTFHFVTSGQTCPVIQSKYGVTLANLVKWNPAIGASCTGMWANTYLCVATL